MGWTTGLPEVVDAHLARERALSPRVKQPEARTRIALAAGGSAMAMLALRLEVDGERLEHDGSPVVMAVALSARTGRTAARLDAMQWAQQASGLSLHQFQAGAWRLQGKTDFE